MKSESAERRKASHIVFIHPSLMGGGAERVSLALASYFVSHGFRFTYLLTKSSVVEYDIPDGVEVVSDFACASLKPFEQIRLIRNFVRQHPTATVISFLPHQNMYSLLATIGLPNRVVISVRNDPSFDFPGNGFLPYLRNFLYTRADSIVFQTIEQQHMFPKAVASLGTIILNPISENIPSRYDGVRRKAIVTSGRLEEQKNHTMTLRAFARFAAKHPGYELEIFGKGTKRAYLEEIALKLGIGNCVKFMGFSSDAVDKVRTASAFVMSSRYEGLSNSMIESLCMGVPTVCTRCLGGGAEAVIRDGVNGILVDVGDVEAEAVALARLVDDEVFAESLSREAACLRGSLSLERIGAQWLDLV